MSLKIAVRFKNFLDAVSKGWSCGPSSTYSFPNPAYFASVVLLMIAMAPSLSKAQEFRALVSGKVSDSTGAAITGARIAIVDVATQVRSSTVSGSDGNYALPQLSPGKY